MVVDDPSRSKGEGGTGGRDGPGDHGRRRRRRSETTKNDDDDGHDAVTHRPDGTRDGSGDGRVETEGKGTSKRPVVTIGSFYGRPGIYP